MLRVDPAVYLLAALMLLTLPLDWVLSALLAAVFHELCHLAAVHLLGGKILSVRIGAGGAVINAELTTPFREFLCSLAGPAGSLLLLALCRYAPKLAICAGVQGLFNLLPISPLDGGRILGFFLEKICPKQAGMIQRGIENGVLLAAAAAAVCCCFACPSELWLAALSLAMIFKAFQRKRPCKQGENRVQ